MRDSQPGCTLNYSVLVLNRYYTAVRITTVRRAFVMLYRELAEVIHLEDGQYANYDFSSWCEISELWAEHKNGHDDWVRAVSFEIRAPRVIRLLRFDRPLLPAPRFNRRNLLARDGHRCQYCGSHYPSSQLSLDHVLPRSRGGETTWDNVVCSCLTCNTRKGGRTPHEARMHLIRSPGRPKHCPQLTMKLGNPRYESWKTFVNGAAASLEFAH
jgi:5-methylcytosine-specific restriction endonuclease McrA